MPRSQPLIIAHAGGAGLAPENTLAAMRASLATDVDAVEVDIQISADGVPILIHDDTVDRTTDGTGAVAALTLAQLKALDAGCRFRYGAFRGERIPTLVEALSLTAGRVPLLLDIKAAGIEQAIIDVLREVSVAIDRDVIVCGFQRDVLLAMRSLEPALACFFTIERAGELTSTLLDEAASLGLAGLTLHFRLINETAVDEAHRRGLHVFAWTVDDAGEAERLRNAGVDAIITNLPPLIA